MASRPTHRVTGTSALAPATIRRSLSTFRSFLSRIVPFYPASGGPYGAPTVGLEIVVKMPSREPVAGHTFGPSVLRSWMKSAPALSAAPVHLLARAITGVETFWRRVLVLEVSRVNRMS